MKTLLVALLLGCHAAFAGLTLTLNPAAQPVSAGAEALFTGTLTNTSTTERLFLNDIAASFTADPQSDTALISNGFFSNVPGILEPGESYAGPLFQLTLSDTSPYANYTGTITLRGGVSITASADLASASFTLLATPVEQWRHRTFGDDAAAPLAADDGDADHDGVENLLEYALSMDALTPDVSLMPAALVLSDHLAVSYIPSAPDVTYRVESSTDLLTWSTTDVEAVTVVNPQPPNRITMRFKNPMSTTARAFLRLNVTR